MTTAPTAEVFGTVERVEQLSPSMVRVVFGGPGLDGFEPVSATDQYVNARFVPDGAPYGVPFDDAALDGVPAELRPRARRFTVRRWDPELRHLTIDFVAHGDVGFAGRWAQRARPGDRLQLSGSTGGYRPDPDADWCLWVGDESAFPAIAASIEELPVAASGVVLVVVDGPENEVVIDVPADVELRWLHRSRAPEPDSLLLDAVRAMAWRDGVVDVFVHGEAGEVRAVRRHLLGERGVDRSSASISPYWRRGRTDEAWREIKGRWVAEQATDV